MSYNPRKHGAACDICPRRNGIPVPPKGPRTKRVRWVWLGQDPGRQETRKGEPFIGNTGARLDKIWRAICDRLGVSIPRSEIWITNSALCEPITTGNAEARLAATCCRVRLLQELKEHTRPNAAILAMGKWAAFGLWGFEKGIGGYTGFHKAVDLDAMLAEAKIKLAAVRAKLSKARLSAAKKRKKP